MAASLLPRPSDMINSHRLPLELCEHIIDVCYEEPALGYFPETPRQLYRTWLRTALVCHDWLHRTRRNLFHYVWVDCSTNCNLLLLLRTLSCSPDLASLVIQVNVGRYNHELCALYARLLDPQFLKNCVHVHLSLLEFPALSRRYANIVFYPFRTSLTSLYDLHMDAMSAPHIPDYDMQMLQKRPCPFDNLTHLETLRSCASMAFPPLMFGSSLTCLMLNVCFGISGHPVA
ncbi:hypothetical protein C8Q74DRAFT_886639 [Fomes fomentarius]|nr:hypothetical protein C8Q74DRAFT_886639 [Fomes fomentarius]